MFFFIIIAIIVSIVAAITIAYAICNPISVIGFEPDDENIVDEFDKNSKRFKCFIFVQEEEGSPLLKYKLKQLIVADDQNAAMTMAASLVKAALDVLEAKLGHQVHFYYYNVSEETL